MVELLFLSHRIPYPPHKGEKIRALQMLNHLRKYCNVHLGCLVDDPSDREHIKTVQDMCSSSYFACINRRWSKLKAFRGLIDGAPLSLKYFTDSRLQRWVDETMRRVKPDLIFIYSSTMAPYVLNNPHKGKVRLADLADVDSEKWREYAHHSLWPLSWIYDREGKKLRQLEEKIAFEVDYTTFVTDAETRLFRCIVPERADNILPISFGVDFSHLDVGRVYEPVYDTSVPNYVFVGTMDYTPNIDAVKWFAEDSLPLIRRRLPKAQFHIVGQNPSSAVQKLAKLDGVFVTGRVKDVRPYVAHATASVAPLRIARGIQTKVLEAMALGVPAIVTRKALEGIHAKPGQEILLADDAPGFAEWAVQCYKTELGQQIGSAGRKRMEESYRWDASMNELNRLFGLPPLGQD